MCGHTRQGGTWNKNNDLFCLPLVTAPNRRLSCKNTLKNKSCLSGFLCLCPNEHFFSFFSKRKKFEALISFSCYKVYRVIFQVLLSLPFITGFSDNERRSLQRPTQEQERDRIRKRTQKERTRFYKSSFDCCWHNTDFLRKNLLQDV